MVWCRYLCPWGILNGIFAMASVMELRSNRHICLTQCKTNACYEGGENAPGCPMYEHPYAMESNKNCILCGNCIKNCPNNSIQLNLRLAAKELWVKVHPYISDSILGISLAFLFVLKKVLEVQSVKDLIFSSYDRYSFYGGLIYTALFIMTILFSTGMLYLIRLSIRNTRAKYKSNVTENIGYAFIPLALCGFLANYLEPLFVKGKAIFYAVKNLILLTPFPGIITPIINLTTLKNLQAVIIISGGLASSYSMYQIISGKIDKLHEEEAIYKTPAIWLIAFLTIIYLVLI
jgi:NAD-dependent dihydropyrimidine dehydrogenase PreA subunit